MRCSHTIKINMPYTLFPAQWMHTIFWCQTDWCYAHNKWWLNFKVIGDLCYAHRLLGLLGGKQWKSVISTLQHKSPPPLTKSWGKWVSLYPKTLLLTETLLCTFISFYWLAVFAPTPPPPGDFRIILCAKRRSTITGKSFIEAYLLMIGTIVHAPRGAQSSCIIFSSKLS